MTKAFLIAVLVLPGLGLVSDVSAQQVCSNLPGTASSGVSFGNVVAGQAYSFQASGCIEDSSTSGHFEDPDGTIYTNGCTMLFTNYVIAGAGNICPGLKAYSLVGKINGGTCLQLGKTGTFVASASGSLTLYYNDSFFGDNSGSFNVCLTPVACTNTLTQISAIQIVGTNVVITIPTVICETYQLQYSDAMVPTNWINVVGASQAGTGGLVQLIEVGGAPQLACLTLPGTAGGGVSLGNVVAGQTYGYSASGCIEDSFTGGHFEDPDGTIYTNGCTMLFTNYVIAGSNNICPGLKAYSLVGKINGGSCLQLGTMGSFVASASGSLTLYYNDSFFNDNSGSFNVCITSPIHRFYRVDIFP
jgi:hypothetical protein